MKKPAYNKANLIGQKSGKLTVIEESKVRKRHDQAYWICQCECGKTTILSTGVINSQRTLSCGCLRRRKAWNNTSVGELSGFYWSSVVCGARDRGIEVLITKEDAWNKFLAQDRKCSLSGIELRFIDHYRDDHKLQTASLDRIDSLKPYTLDNIQWVHKTVNKMKNTLDQDEFISWCHLISEKYNATKEMH
jgi:hypothetical protein